MEILETFNPSILLSEIYYPYRFQKGIMVDAIKRIADEDFFRGIEIDVIEEANDRKRIKNVIDSKGIVLTQWMTSIILREKLNISSIDKALRKKSIMRIKEYINSAAECGVTNLAVISGPDPGLKLRKFATESLYDSLCELTDSVSEYNSMRVIIEPLDRGVHKNMLIGPTNEAISLVNKVRKLYPEIGISWDSAHVALCGENIYESLELSCGYISQIHLSNAVLDVNHPDFGDYHIKMGSPGFLNKQTIARIFKKAIDIGLFIKVKPCVSIEVRTKEGNDPSRGKDYCKKVLLDAWDFLMEKIYKEI